MKYNFKYLSLSKVPKLHQEKLTSFLLLACFFIGFFYWLWLLNNKNPEEITSKTGKEPINQEQQTNVISGIARVIDGDTIVINDNHIRLIGIDAPETKQKCLDKNYFEYFCGQVSTVFLKNLAGGKNVDCGYSGKDIYHRFLGVCYLGKINLNQEMIRSGMAIIYNLKDADEELKILESQAQKNKIGIWQGAFLEPKEYRKKNRGKDYKNNANKKENKNIN